MGMHRCFRVAFLALLLTSAACAADVGNCSVRKGQYEAWLSLAKHAPTRPVRGASLAPATQTAPDTATAEGMGREYRNYFQCISDAPLPADDDGGRSLCKDAAVDRLPAAVCQTALYLKTGRKDATDLLDSLPANKRSAEMIWDLQKIAVSGSAGIFLPDGPAYKIVDELFVLVLDDKETAVSKYFHVVANAVGPDGKHVDAQIKILLREAPAVVVKQWEVL